jgi:hypothetical protein
LHCPLFPICLKGSITHRLYRAWRRWVQFQRWRFII